MNFKSILIVGLSFATLGLSLPAHADTATVVDNNQSAIVTGNRNTSYQNNNTGVSNSQTGRRTTSNTGTAVSNTQAIDVQGNRNTTIQNNGTTVINSIRRTTR
jgi:biopolymer transport protein ExbD